MDIVNISSIEEYVSKIKELFNNHFKNIRLYSNTNTTPWFRGQDIDAPLLPKLFRGKHNENNLIQDFRIKSQSLDKTPDYERIDEWLFLMQHHGLPTRLLDWSESSLIALFFAIYSNKSLEDMYPVVWMLCPYNLNKISTKNHTLPLSWLGSNVLLDENKLDTRGLKNFQAAFISDENDANELPVALRPQYIHKRLLAQKSCFTIHGKSHDPIESIFSDLVIKNLLVKIIINKNSITDMKRDLRLLGITYSTVFPDLEGLSKDLIDLY